MVKGRETEREQECVKGTLVIYKKAVDRSVEFNCTFSNSPQDPEIVTARPASNETCLSPWYKVLHAVSHFVKDKNGIEFIETGEKAYWSETTNICTTSFFRDRQKGTKSVYKRQFAGECPNTLHQNKQQIQEGWTSLFDKFRSNVVWPSSSTRVHRLNPLIKIIPW